MRRYFRTFVSSDPQSHAEWVFPSDIFGAVDMSVLSGEQLDDYLSCMSGEYQVIDLGVESTGD